MNRFVTLLALAIALGGPASAQTSYELAPDFRNPRVVGGEINADGTIARGRGFRARHIATGEYEITFKEQLFLTACPIMTVTTLNGYGMPIIDQGAACSRRFKLNFYLPGPGNVDEAFQFIAVGTQ